MNRMINELYFVRDANDYKYCLYAYIYRARQWVNSKYIIVKVIEINKWEISK